MRTIVGLAIVIAVIWGLAWIMRQVKAGREAATRRVRPGLASVAALTLGSGAPCTSCAPATTTCCSAAPSTASPPIHRYTEEQARDAGLLAEPGRALEQPVRRSRLATVAGHLRRASARAPATRSG